MNAVQRVTALIEKLIEDGGEIGIRELALRTGIPKSSVQRILDSLKSCGWVVQAPQSQNYHISMRLLMLSNGWRLRQELVVQSQDVMQDLCDRSNATVLLLILDGERGICLNKVEPTRTIKLIANTGESFPLNAAACGKILLTYAPPRVQQKVLESQLPKYTEKTITSSDDLRLEIEQIRARGIALSMEEMTSGAAEIAAPLLDTDGNLIAGLSIAGPCYEIEKRLDEFAALLKDGAARICGLRRDSEGSDAVA